MKFRLSDYRDRVDKIRNKSIFVLNMHMYGKYVATSRYIFGLHLNFTNVTTAVASHYGANKISKCFI